MARLVHLSDLHFGAHDEELVEAVEHRVGSLKPDLVVISGDFTERARTEQFKDACAFLERLREAGHEVLGVPGNHDIPLYDVLRRFLSPLTRYRRFIDETLCPFIELNGVAVLGINTARSFTFTEGGVSREQVEFIRETFARIDPDAVRVLVTHRPLPDLDAIEEAGVDLLLAGHADQAPADLATRVGATLAIQAGTATSTRVGGEKQSFNVIDIDDGKVTLTVASWGETGFQPGDAQRFEYQDGEWRILPAEEPAH